MTDWNENSIRLINDAKFYRAEIAVSIAYTRTLASEGELLCGNQLG
jgi:hypothetical protein